MAQQNDTDFDIDDFEDDPAGLRKALNALRKERDSLRTELSETKASTRSASIEKAFKERGIPDKVKALVPADVDLDQWLTEYGDAFSTKPAENTGGEEEPTKPSATPTEEEQRQNAAQASAVTPPLTGNAKEAYRNAATDEERGALFKQFATQVMADQ